MSLQPTIVKTVIHPLVASAFIKHHYAPAPRRGRKYEEVLVLDARTDDMSPADVQSAILSDLDLIMDQLRQDELHIDSVEIRLH